MNTKNLTKNTAQNVSMMRPRRLRRTSQIRDLVQENHLNINDFIYPVFVMEGNGYQSSEIQSMPGICRFSIDSLLKEIDETSTLGIKAIAIFPVIDHSLKTDDGVESFNPDGLTQRTVKAIKARFPEMVLITDVALDPYTTHGHDGVVDENKILNDETVEILTKMALVQAEAGADIVAPSDMMDCRIGAIRQALDNNGFEDTATMSYAAKYASCLYGPFRDAIGSQTTDKQLFIGDSTKIPKDKKTYQMNPANSMEAERELELDIAEGADFVMVKPAGFYLDIIAKFKSKSPVPVVAYQTSGEYSMIHFAAERSILNLNEAIYESLISIKRAGADLIFSYFAKQVARAVLNR